MKRILTVAFLVFSFSAFSQEFYGHVEIGTYGLSQDNFDTMYLTSLLGLNIQALEIGVETSFNVNNIDFISVNFDGFFINARFSEHVVFGFAYSSAVSLTLTSSVDRSYFNRIYVRLEF